MALYPPLSARPAGPAGAAQEEHLLLLRDAAAAGLRLDIGTCWSVPVYIGSQNVLRLDDSLLPRRHFRRMEAWLEGLLLRLALAGPAGYLKAQEYSATSPSRVLCSWLCLTLAEIERIKKKAWKEVAVHPPLCAGPARPAGAAPEEHLLLLRDTAAAGLRLDRCTCLDVAVFVLSLNLPRLDDSLPRSLWPNGRGGAGKEGPARQFLSPPLGPWQLLRWRLARKDCCCGWLSQECSAPSPAWVLCC